MAGYTRSAKSARQWGADSVSLRASGTTWSGDPGNPWQGGGGSQPGWLATDDNAARGRLGRGGGVGARTAAASPAVLLPGALSMSKRLARLDSSLASRARRRRGSPHG